MNKVNVFPFERHTCSNEMYIQRNLGQLFRIIVQYAIKYEGKKTPFQQIRSYGWTVTELFSKCFFLPNNTTSDTILQGIGFLGNRPDRIELCSNDFEGTI